MATVSQGGRLLLAAACLVIVFIVRAQSPALSITLTGKSMIRSDIRPDSRAGSGFTAT